MSHVAYARALTANLRAAGIAEPEVQRLALRALTKRYRAQKPTRKAYALKSSPSGGRRIALRSSLPMVGEDAATVTFQVAYEGTWKGHHQGGEFSLTAADFKQIVANFNADPRGAVPLDWEHTSVRSDEAPAAGWVRSLEVRKGANGAELWATAELTAKAADQIRAGSYKFVSGVFEFDAPDHVSGESRGTIVSSVALTNSPFLQSLEPLSLAA